MANALEVDGLRKAYQVGVRGCALRVRVLRGVTFHVAIGERVGIVGAAGAGKTTLLHCVAGLRRPDAGRLVLAGPLGDTMLLLDEHALAGAGRHGRPASALLFARDADRLRGHVDRILVLVDGRVEPARDALDLRGGRPEIARQVAEPAVRRSARVRSVR